MTNKNTRSWPVLELPIAGTAGVCAWEACSLKVQLGLEKWAHLVMCITPLVGHKVRIGNLVKLQLEWVSGIVRPRRNASFNVSENAGKLGLGVQNPAAPLVVVND